MTEIAKEKLDKILTDFRNAGPWTGTIAERKAKFESCFYQLCEASELDLDGWRIAFEIPNKFSEWTSSGASHADYQNRVVTLRGRLSVITLFHEFGHAYFGKNAQDLLEAQLKAQEFAMGLFKKYFPDKFARLHQDSETGMFVK